MRRMLPWILEAALVVYFVIGKYAHEPRLAIGAWSVNQLLELPLVAVCAGWIWQRRRGITPASRTLWLVVALTGVVLAGVLRTNNWNYALGKGLGLAFVLLPVACMLSGVRDEARVRRLLAFWALIGGTMMLLGVVAVLRGRVESRLALFGGGANVYARMVGSSVLIAATLVDWRRRRTWPLAALALLGAACTLLFAGSKAVVLATGCSLAFYAWFQRWPRRAWCLAAVTGAFLVAPVIVRHVVGDVSKTEATVRMFRLDPDDPAGSYGTRVRFYSASLQALPAAGWIGMGTGSWGPSLGFGAGRRYPHNPVLELVCEQGAVGAALVILTVLWMITLLRRAWKCQRCNRLVAALWSLEIFWILNAMVSGDLLDNRHLWWPLLLLEGLQAADGRRADSAQRVLEPGTPLESAAGMVPAGARAALAEAGVAPGAGL